MKYIGILSLSAILLVGFGYYTLFATPANETASRASKDQAEFAVETDSSAVVVKKETLNGIGTLDYLRLLNENLECKISYVPTENGSEVEGTYFVSNGSMRGDFLTQSPDLSGQVLSSMIIDGTTMYIWSEIEDEIYGAKLKVSLLLDDSVETNEPVSLDEEVSYKCDEWKGVDNTIFIPPSEVLFIDLGTVSGSEMEYGTIYEEEGEF